MGQRRAPFAEAGERAHHRAQQQDILWSPMSLPYFLFDRRWFRCGMGAAVVFAAAALSRIGAAPPARPRTFANPIDIDYRFMTSPPSRREAADPAIILFQGDYYLFASKSGGYWYSSDMIDWKFVKPEGLDIEAYAPAVMELNGALYYTTAGA